jgi:hypothetical protein
MATTLTLTGAQRDLLARHLFPNDGCEAVAIALCGRAESGPHQRMVVRRIVLVPYEICRVRRADQVTWPTEFIVPFIAEAAANGWAMIKIHGHRAYAQFSDVDDASDRALFPSLYAWLDTDKPLASAILMDDGSLFGRTVRPDGTFETLERVTVVGDDLSFYLSEQISSPVPASGQRVAQVFGQGTFDRLRKLRVAVIGCSGTGSIVIEQLARNGVGALLLVDPDVVEEKNLNRIANATVQDARVARSKVEVAARSIRAMGLGTEITLHARTLFAPDVVRAVSVCDVVIGCMDTIDGRHVLNKLACFYLQPYIDLGVRIDADGHGGVTQVCGSVHYLRPDGSSLLSRNTYSLEQVRAAAMQRTDPVGFRRQLEEGYIRGVQEDRPAVIQLNSLVASIAVNELLARLHPFRLDPNQDYAVTRVSLSHGIWEHEAEGAPCTVLARHAGRGNVEPLIDWTELGVGARAA